MAGEEVPAVALVLEVRQNVAPVLLAHLLEPARLAEPVHPHLVLVEDP
jgi:hypothetical protein